MYTKITGEFESVEFAETAARYIRERVNGEKQIIIYPNKNKFKGCADSEEAFITSHEKIMMLLPYSADSNNYATSLITRPIDTSAAVKEPLLTKSVRMEVTCEHKNKEKVIQYMISCGGYEIHSWQIQRITFEFSAYKLISRTCSDGKDLVINEPCLYGIAVKTGYQCYGQKIKIKDS